MHDERHRRCARVEIERAGWALRQWIAEHTGPWSRADQANYTWLRQRADAAQRAARPPSADGAHRAELCGRIAQLEEIVRRRAAT